MSSGVGVGMRVGASAAPWTPTRLGSGVELWLRSDPATMSLSGSAIVSLADQSGKGRDWNDGSTSTRRPAFSATAYGGRPGITFDGTSDYLVPAGAAYTFTATTTIALVSTPSTAATSYVIGGSGANFGFISNFAGWLEFFNGADRKDFAVPTSGTKFTALVTQTDGAALVGRTNGVQAFSAVPAVAMAGRQLNTIGAAPGGTNFANSTIAELIVVSRVLTAAEIGQLESYLRTRHAHY